MIDMLYILSLLDFPQEFSYPRQLAKIIKGIYNISSGGVTQKNISRQTASMGLGYRSVQRFFSSQINWVALSISIVLYLFPELGERVFLLALDEVVEGKSGKQTHGIGRFFSSIAGKPIRSVCYHVCSLIDVSSGKSLVLNFEQRYQEEKKKKESTKQAEKKRAKSAKKKAGRPKGSKNKVQTKEYTALSLSFERLLSLILPLLAAVNIIPAYVVADGAYGSKTFLLITRELGPHLISKLRVNTALYLPYEEKQEGKKTKGRKKKYGDKIDYDTLNPESEYYVKTTKDEDKPEVKIEIYQISKVWVKFLPVLINVVILKAINSKTGKVGRRILFSTDLNLSAELIIQYYCLRFKIEFNFRDAKQYFGLAHFRAYKERQVQNSVGLAFFMVNFTNVIRKIVIDLFSLDQVSILDLKALFNAEKHYDRLLKLLKIDPCLIKKKDLIFDLAKVEAPNLAHSLIINSLTNT